MKAIYRWTFCVVLMLATALAAVGLLSHDTSAAEPQAASAQKGTAPTAPQSASTQKGTASAPQTQEGAVSRGQYLVDNIGMCSECHTPRDAEGNLDNRHYLQGAPIWIMPVHNVTNWAMRAPAIAGLEGFTDAQAQTVLEKGIGPNGIEIQRPMHIYHMNHSDAQAIVAYLRSLPSNYTNP
jgi:mono/diheme cytochrome c family protein